MRTKNVIKEKFKIILIKEKRITKTKQLIGKKKMLQRIQ